MVGQESFLNRNLENCHIPAKELHCVSCTALMMDFVIFTGQGHTAHADQQNLCHKTYTEPKTNKGEKTPGCD